MSLKTVLQLAATAKLTTPLDLGTAQASAAVETAVTLTDGTAAGQANAVFADTRTLAASANEDLDLAGALTDPLGAVVTFARVKALIIKAADANTNNVVVGGAGSNAWAALFGAATHTVTLRPGATLALIARSTDATGYAVTAATADLLRIANSGAGSPVAYSIVIVGASV